MSQLNAQEIEALCRSPSLYAPVKNDRSLPMISPFTSTRAVVNGSSYGLSAASYDVRIAHDLTLGPNPAASIAKSGYMSVPLKPQEPFYALAHTLEDLAIPADVCAYVIDKSTYARRFVIAFNTYIDPGFYGNLTLELINHGPDCIQIKAGDPICQLVFHWLTAPTDRPYAGKYQAQKREAVGPIFEVGLPS